MSTSRSSPCTFWRAVAVLAIGSFVTTLNLTIPSPLLTGIATTFNTTEATTGQLATISSILATVLAFLVAGSMERFDRRTWLRLQASILLVATVISALAPSFGWLIGGRVLAGAGCAVILANCLTAASDLCPDPADRDRVIGIIVSATTMSIIVGLPIVAQIAAHLNWRFGVAVLLLPAGALLAGTTWLPPQQRTARAVTGRSRFFASYRPVLGHRRTVSLLVVFMLFGVVYVGWLTYFGAYVEQDFGQGANTLSALFLIAGIAELFANNLAPWLMRRVAAEQLIVVLTGIFAGSLLVTDVFIFSNVWALFLTASLISACAAMLYIVCNALLLDAQPQARDHVMAIASSFGGGGAALGALIGGLLLQTLGDYASMYRSLGLLLPFAIFCLYLAGSNPTETAPTP
ncbi:MAG: hypothetical protein C4345_06360 [Chloroflexota bacterium]